MTASNHTFSGANAIRYDGASKGHYESYFQRANHPTRPLALWIRYTIFAPHNRPNETIGELWAIWFDGETHRHAAAKTEVPIQDCSFSSEGLSAQIGKAVLDSAGLRGSAEGDGNHIEWDLSYKGDNPPLLLLDEGLYQARIPKAKALVGMPNAEYNGTMVVNGESHSIDSWPGSQNHNWGSKHTDYYAWGQVCGFDNAPDSFLEVATGKLKFGPIWTPFMSPVAFRHEGKEYHMGSIMQGFKADAGFSLFDWNFAMKNDAISLVGNIRVDAQDVVGLRYYNPPGGTKSCLNSKIARCELNVTMPDQPTIKLLCENRAAFEILTDATDHGIRIRV